MSNLREYVITLHKHDDLDEFYLDMETLRTTMYGVMPDRAVDCFERRPISRNTHYKLTTEEAEELKKDPRIIAVELSMAERGIEARPFFTQTTPYWDKSNTINNGHRNWGLYRCTRSGQIAGWGSDNTPNKSGTVTTTSSGKNVDVIISDGHFDPTHPEYAVNSDGTGGSRVNQFNWFTYLPEVRGTAAGVYTYTPYFNVLDSTNEQNNHGAHVAGTACGNTQGWARDATIYNINPYASNPNANATGDFHFDYIRQFHLQKAINPATGLKNPTIVNCSWGNTISINISDIQKLFHQGVTTDNPTMQNCIDAGFGLTVDPDTGDDQVILPILTSSVEADVSDCIAAGIILIGAAGNDGMRGTRSSLDLSYGDYILFTYAGGTYLNYYGRGHSPGSYMITVGASDSTSAEYKADFSNCGPNIDIFAPGTFIISSVNNLNSWGGTYDYRNTDRSHSKISGTSMASPQVAGVIACVVEHYPKFNQADMLTYLQKSGETNSMGDSGNYPADNSDLQGAPNLYLKYKLERPVDGLMYPRSNTLYRLTSGQVYPRPRVYRFGPSPQ